MFFDLNNIEHKRKEQKIKALDIAIKERELQIAKFEERKLSLEIDVIENEVSEDELIKKANDFLNDPSIQEEKTNEILERVSSLPKDPEGKVVLEMEEFYKYCIIAFGYYGLNIKNLTEEVSSLRNEKIELQKKLVNEIQTERKYKELLKDE